ncbi:MAG: DUF2304 domain-containing protein [Gaiellaceae bacterium]|jgi:hypothetical protein
MIVVQILLIGGIVAVFGWFLIHPRSYRVKAWIKILTALFTALAVVVIISPRTSSGIAHLVGVGRGADLLLYVLAVAFIFVILNLYNGSREDEKKFVALARKVALLEAKLNSLGRDEGEKSQEPSATRK